MSDTFFTLDERDDGVSLLTLSRPERMNTMTPAFFPALRDAVARLNAGPHARAGDRVHRQTLQRRHGAGRVRWATSRS
jgi:hypothetical protein